MIFTQIDRSDVDPAKYTESYFSFLNRSARIEAERVRDLMEEWLSDYPFAERSQLAIRLQSSINAEFLAAYFELYLFSLLSRLGYSIEIHPKMKSSERYACEGGGRTWHLR